MKLFLQFVLLLCSAATAIAEDAIYPPVNVPMELHKVSDHVYYVQGVAGVATDNEGFVSNAGFVVTGAGVVVLDALGTPSLGNAFIAKIRSVTSEPIVRVIVTHFHADHIYGLQPFAALGAEVVAPAGAQQYLNSPAASERLEERRLSLDPWVNDSTELVWPDRYIGEPESFRLGDVEFVLSPIGGAHSDGDLTLYVKTDRVLFSGDVIFEGRVPYLGDANTAHWLTVLEDMGAAQLTALVPGHGGVAADPNAAITATRDYLAFLRKHMGRAVDDFVPFADAYGDIDWTPFQHLPAFAEANRRNAYQVYLSMEAETLGQ